VTEIIKPTHHSRNWSILILVVTAGIFIASYLLFFDKMIQMQAIVRRSGSWGILLSVGVYGLLGLTPIPSEPITLFLTTIYGPFWAMVACAFGNLFAAIIEYWIGRRIGCAANFEGWREKLPFRLGEFPVNSPVFLIAARNIPGYGSKFVSLIAGIYRVPLWRYSWTTFLSTLFGAALIAYGGFALIDQFLKMIGK